VSLKNVRNIAIVLVIAALIVILPGGGTAASVVFAIVRLVFYGSLGWVAMIMYREHKTTLYGLGDGRRAVLYGAVAVAALVLTATSRLWQTSAGSVAWLLLMAGAVYAVFAVVWSARQE
jgi:hypothetical protein